MHIDLRITHWYDRINYAYTIRVIINSELFSYTRDVAMFEILRSGSVRVVFEGDSPEQRTTLPKTKRGEAAIAQATTIFAPQVVSAIKAELGMSDRLAKRLLAEKQLLLFGSRKDCLMTKSAAGYYTIDGIRMVDIQHRMALKTENGDYVTVSDWDTVGAIYSIPCGFAEESYVIASPKMCMDGRMLVRAKLWGRGNPARGGQFLYFVAGVENTEKQYAIMGAELFAQADTAWLFTCGITPSNPERATYDKPYPLVVTREVK